jgi:hypothetical protein
LLLHWSISICQPLAIVFMLARVLTLLFLNAVRSGSNFIWCACAICRWPCRSSCRRPRFFQVLCHDTCWIVSCYFGAWRCPPWRCNLGLPLQFRCCNVLGCHSWGLRSYPLCGKCDPWDG